MLRIVCATAFVFAGIATTALASPAMATPTFREIEASYSDQDVSHAGREAILRAIPVGLSMTEAEAVLIRAGASCRPTHRDPQIIRCLYDEVTTIDEAVDDTRWETILHIQGGNVSAVDVKREVNRHGTT